MHARRGSAGGVEVRPMARKKRPTTLRPRKPARIRNKPKPKPVRRGGVASHHRPELAGLALVGIGIFFGAVLYGSWNGGTAGAWLARGLRDLVGVAAYVVPVVLVALGALLLGRSRLVDFRPFRLGLLATALGLGFVLGRHHGGYFGKGLDDALGRAIGSTGLTILGVFTLLAGILLVTGASVGAILRRSHNAMRLVGRSARRTLERPQRPKTEPVRYYADEPVAPSPALVDGVQDYPDVVSSVENVYEPEPML